MVVLLSAVFFFSNNKLFSLVYQLCCFLCVHSTSVETHVNIMCEAMKLSNHLRSSQERLNWRVNINYYTYTIHK